jgi:hypothetical protein
MVEREKRRKLLDARPLELLVAFRQIQACSCGRCCSRVVRAGCWCSDACVGGAGETSSLSAWLERCEPGLA